MIYLKIFSVIHEALELVLNALEELRHLEKKLKSRHYPSNVVEPLLKNYFFQIGSKLVPKKCMCILSKYIELDLFEVLTKRWSVNTAKR